MAKCCKCDGRGMAQGERCRGCGGRGHDAKCSRCGGRGAWPTSQGQAKCTQCYGTGRS